MKDFTPKSNIEDFDSVALVQITSLWAQSIWTFINGFEFHCNDTKFGWKFH